MSTPNHRSGWVLQLTQDVFLYQGQLLLWEATYFQLMAGMRMLRMKIPMYFTPDFLEKEILQAIQARNSAAQPQVWVRIRIYRRVSAYASLHGREEVDLDILISADHRSEYFTLASFADELPLYTEHRISASIIQGLDWDGGSVPYIAEVVASENGWADALLLNDQKRLTSSLHGAIWLLGKDRIWKTPAYEEGARRSVFRDHFLHYLEKSGETEVFEGPLSPFELNEAIGLVLQCDPFRFYLVARYKRREYDLVEMKQVIAGYLKATRATYEEP